MKLSAADRLRQLTGGASRALESGGKEGEITEERLLRSLDRLREELTKRVTLNPDTSLGEDAANAFYQAAEDGLNRLFQDGVGAELTDEHQFGLEAIIETDGSRPSAPVRDGWIDVTDPRLGHWRSDLVIFEADIRAAIAATARIVVDGELSDRAVNGTAVMIAPGYAATAKHVVEQSFSRFGDAWHVPFNRKITLDFHVEAGAPPRENDRIDVVGVKRASADVIGTTLDLENLDLAVLELAAPGPAPAPIAPDLDFPVGPPLIHVIGHPKRVREPAPAPAPRDAFEEILQLVFGVDFGVKRWSPGEILVGPGTLDEDRVNKRVMAHDASTLAGNSGSPVFDLATEGNRLFGIHYGGFFEDRNYAHGGPAVSQWLTAAVSETDSGLG